jgi:FixJ family two-component response regulator
MATEEKPKVVVIVDDDESVRTALQSVMKQGGLPVLAFASAEEFLNSGEQDHTACVIVASVCRESQGCNSSQKLNTQHHRIPFIFVTTLGDEKMRMQALRAGAVEFLTKPFDVERLLDSVRAALDS